MGVLGDGWTRADVEKLIEEGDPYVLCRIPHNITIECFDYAWAKAICFSLATHSDEIVRGNALMGLGYLSMWCTDEFEPECLDLIRSGLGDADEWPRNKAITAMSQVRHQRPDLFPEE